MKKLAIAAIVFAAFGSMEMAQAASSGTITFNGEVTATTCDVTVAGQAADATVTLPTVGQNELQTAGATTGRTSFPMQLDNCAGTLTTASAFFQDGPSVDINGRLQNLSGTATNVSLQLLDDQNAGNVINVGDSSQVDGTSYVDVSSGSATMKYGVEYYAEGAATPGTVVSNVVYNIQYK
ncbi:type 1 fimbrial protein [Serratia proteamaculans]|uniref:fimbrial protein n=1 Tax=Serratia proteamaculans TaxID=28151 RepID=UPI0015774084|nr:fimbrial protein [Serratia proteamaculans]NTX77447.1 type 1 fimbrial protein [Serratia proteamaculans]NTZ28310.1 type 1 fimbrial protein [Serratia proteamaculans]